MNDTERTKRAGNLLHSGRGTKLYPSGSAPRAFTISRKSHDADVGKEGRYPIIGADHEERIAHCGRLGSPRNAQSGLRTHRAVVNGCPEPSSASWWQDPTHSFAHGG